MPTKPLNPLTPTLINAGSQVAGGILGYIGQRQTNRTNLRLAKDARDHDVNMWNMQNAYNTPQMQMQRLKEAGLNPHLMYGQGNTGNAATPQKAPVPEVGNELSSLAQMSLAPALSMYQDWRVKNAQIENLNANADATRQNATLTALRQITQDYLNKRHSIQLPWVNIHEMNKSDLGRNRAEIENTKNRYLYDTLGYRTNQEKYKANILNYKAKTAKSMFHEALPSQIQQIILRNNLLEQTTKSYKLDNQLNELLKPQGTTTKDPLLHRLLMRIIKPQEGQPNILNMTVPELWEYTKTKKPWKK